MNDEKSSLRTNPKQGRTISAKAQLRQSLRNREYRRAFVQERVRTSIALQIRALRDQRDLTQQQFGSAIGMAQTWVSRLENPEYGKLTVATILRVADFYDTDVEIKFRPFSWTLRTIPKIDSEYFSVPSYDDEFGEKLDSAPAPEEAQSGADLAEATAEAVRYQRELPFATVNEVFVVASTNSAQDVPSSGMGNAVYVGAALLIKHSGNYSSTLTSNAAFKKEKGYERAA